MAVVWSQRARADLRAIFTHIAADNTRDGVADVSTIDRTARFYPEDVVPLAALFAPRVTASAAGTLALTLGPCPPLVTTGCPFALRRPLPLGGAGAWEVMDLSRLLSELASK